MKPNDEIAKNVAVINDASLALAREVLERALAALADVPPSEFGIRDTKAIVQQGASYAMHWALEKAKSGAGYPPT